MVTRMSLTDLSLFQALKSKMHWHQTRQSVLAENVANADTPGYAAREVKDYSFKDHLGLQTAGLETARTTSGHLAGRMSANSTKVEEEDMFEITPSGNNVVLEEQMMKVTENQMDFQAASTLYSRGLGLIRTALAKNA